MERQDEVTPLPYDFGNRLYDPRRGQFPTPDKLSSQSPWQSPYVFAGNTPIQAIDKNGDKKTIVNVFITNKTTTTIANIDYNYVGLRFDNCMYSILPVANSYDVTETNTLDLRNNTATHTRETTPRNWGKAALKDYWNNNFSGKKREEQEFGYVITSKSALSYFDDGYPKAKFSEHLDLTELNSIMSGFYKSPNIDNFMDRLKGLKAQLNKVTQSAGVGSDLVDKLNDVKESASNSIEEASARQMKNQYFGKQKSGDTVKCPTCNNAYKQNGQFHGGSDDSVITKEGSKYPVDNSQ